MRILAFVLLISGVLFASNPLATIVKIEGTAKVLKSGTIKKDDAVPGQSIFEGDMVITSSGSMAAVEFVDKSKVILDEKSKLLVQGFDAMKQEGGKVYYEITKRGAQGLKVATNFAVIGVKGTKFVITDDNKTQSVALKEGLVGVQSIQAEFALYRQQLEEEFDAFMKEQEKEFEAFKKEGQEAVFVGNFKEIDLEPGKTITISGNRADESADLEAIAQEFSRFESF